MKEIAGTNKKIDLSQYKELIETICKIEYKKFSSLGLLEFSEVINVGNYTIYYLLKNSRSSASFNKAYLSNAIKWAIRNEIRRRYKWYLLKNQEQTGSHYTPLLSIDDIEGDSSKEFLTVTTKNNNTFYIVIDRSSTTDNVYMLSQIDENDLKDFLEEEPETETKTPGIVLDEEKVGDETPDVVLDDAADSTKDNVEPNVGLLSMLALAGAGVGAYYFFKIRKAKQDDDDSPDEGLETGGMEEDMETVNEDEEATQNN